MAAPKTATNRALRKQYRAEGKCWWGNHPAMPGASMCERHLIADRESRRRRLGHRPWTKGARGRPLKVAP